MFAVGRYSVDEIRGLRVGDESTALKTNAAFITTYPHFRQSQMGYAPIRERFRGRISLRTSKRLRKRSGGLARTPTDCLTPVNGFVERLRVG